MSNFCKYCNLCNKCGRVSAGTLTIRCRKCGAAIKRSMRACPQCNTPVPPPPGGGTRKA